MKIYLYVKQHRVTGLKYFGVTIKKDPKVYLGSGLHWRRHLKTHGNDVDTLEIWEFDDQDECERFALEFSEKNNIVESTEWANLRPENARAGRPIGSPGLAGPLNPRYGKTKELNPFYGKKHKEETIQLYKKQKGRSANPRAKPVTTPYGKFGCVADAADAEGINPRKISRRIERGVPGYFWG